MHRRDVGLDTLLILLRKATTSLKRYETFRTAGENGPADRLLPHMFELRNDITAAYKGALSAEDPADRPSDQVMEQVQFLLRALAPGIRRPVSEVNLDGTRLARRAKVRRSLPSALVPRNAPVRKPADGTATVKLDKKK